ncbi:hypothetical protein M422DRAFT_60564 [Sphaerobolus stellatus SS14]|uniref:SWIM-type domain-containing protein n=1 Tax=Sphaerobolus stellatus (strain SS14) TaxID=990650 RepID=A0A0C9UBT6_SPHS4|nr:hypothetical protein M422DRAFT_60564 [Sphaerobolus stellatus SS14]
MVFTAGVKTNGRCKSENCINKSISGLKSTAKELFDALNEHTAAQSGKEQECVRVPIRLLREHAGPKAVHTSYQQMQLSMFYQVEAVQLPPGLHNWGMHDTFSNDNRCISSDWLFRIIHDRGLQIQEVFHVVHMSSGTSHMLAVLDQEYGAYICDCCMGCNLGILCRHFFAVWVNVQDTVFHLWHIQLI